MAPITLPKGPAALRLFLLEHFDKLEQGARQGLYRFAEADRIHQVADAAFDLVAKLLESRADLQFESLDKLRGFLFKAAFRLALDHYDRFKREHGRTQPIEAAGASSAVSPLDLAVGSERAVILAQAMERLAKHDWSAYEAVLACVIGGCAPGDLAARLKISLQRVNARIASGCKQLAPILARMGYYRETL